MRTLLQQIVTRLNMTSLFLAMFCGAAQASDLPVLRKVDPIVPPIARQLSVEGTVRLRLTVNRDGHVSQVVVLGGNPILLEAAKAAVKHWVYAPTGKRTDIEVALVFRVPRPTVLEGRSDPRSTAK